MSTVIKGTCKWYSGKKGFGFIEREDGQKDVFIHASAIKAGGLRFLNEGDKLEFELSEDSGKGPSAINIKKID
jgi:CspA family cold shock protein|tara:strand:- start:1127 stop:1345 length:219 start_codon:yes stop_codon:yes gene_type:complete